MSNPNNIAPGVWVSGKVISSTVVREITTKEGRKFTFAETKVLAGAEFVSLSEMQKDATHPARLFKAGEDIVVPLRPPMSGLFKLDI
jgi:hypothetical protein